VRSKIVGNVIAFISHFFSYFPMFQTVHDTGTWFYRQTWRKSYRKPTWWPNRNGEISAFKWRPVGCTIWDTNRVSVVHASAIVVAISTKIIGGKCWLTPPSKKNPPRQTIFSNFTTCLHLLLFTVFILLFCLVDCVLSHDCHIVHKSKLFSWPLRRSEWKWR